MGPTYENTRKFVEFFDGHMNTLDLMCLHYEKEKEELSEEIEKVKNGIESIRNTILLLQESNGDMLSIAETEEKIKTWRDNLRGTKDVPRYLSCAAELVTLCHATARGSSCLQEEQVRCEAQIKRVKSHPKYRLWVKNADKLKYTLIDGAMPEQLSDYSDRALKMIIAYGSKVLWEPYKRYMYYHLYTIYKATVQGAAERKAKIELFNAVHDEMQQLIPQWLEALFSEVNVQNEKLAELQEKYDGFDEATERNMTALVDIFVKSTEDEYPPEEWNRFYSSLDYLHLRWTDISTKENVQNYPTDLFVLHDRFGFGTQSFDTNPYTMMMAERIQQMYSTFVSLPTPEVQQIMVRAPYVMNLDVLLDRFCMDFSEASQNDRNNINGVVQNLAATVAASVPVGKAKFIFGDPGNTGVFSNFKNIGKNDSEGSTMSTYIVDTDGIRLELERLSNQIAYTINNILQGTKTTLYQHNKQRAFNSSPYEFLFLMDFPQNMTAQSLQALKNIVENGPKCGIFTFIFYSGGTAMEMLRAEEQKMVQEIAVPDYVYGECGFADEHGYMIPGEEEVDTEQFNHFIACYNEAMKDSQQLTVALDELDGKVNLDGEYKIPIGKNLGGETEYMAFFGSCQDYLMSGAPRIGKTNALHVIIYNTLKYVPNAELYLVDFKQGVEFAPYAGLNHPVIKALAVESVPEFGYAVLKHIEQKIKAISELFINNAVKNWKEYYEKTGKVIPVTVVILDEFQHLFDTDVGKDCTRIIEVIAREGGAFNVHIILATQSMNNVSGLTAAAKDNIFGRMVFYHSEQEYKYMLWDDAHLALTLSSEIKGQMVFATGDKKSQRLLQWALAKSVPDVVQELGHPVEQGRYQTKLLLSTVRENPFSVFNAIIKNRYHVEDPDVCEITIGNEVDVFTGDLRRQLEAGEPLVSMDYMEKSYLKLVKRPNENILFVGHNEDLVEGSFQLALYCALAKQVALGRRHSIVLLAPDMSAKLVEVARSFPDYIDYYSQEDPLSDIQLENKEFMFVFGLQNFRSMSYQPDAQLITARMENIRSRMPGSYMPHQSVGGKVQTDGQLLQEAVESEHIHVVAWHNSMQNLCSMFGGSTKIQDFLCRFIHKIGFRMTDKNDSRLFINSDACTELSKEAALYVKMNKERVIRPYKAMDGAYCAEIDKALQKIDGGEVE